MKRDSWSVYGSVLAACAAVVFILGCEWPWEDDDSDAAGTSTIQGYVNSFKAGGVNVSFAPPREPELLKSFIAGLSEAFVPSAYAAGIRGVTVSLRGTDLRATTGSGGFFVLGGVPSGDHELVFAYGGNEAVYQISVEENVRVELSNIKVGADGAVTVANTKVVELAASGGSEQTSASTETRTATTSSATTTTTQGEAQAATTTTTTTTSTTTTTNTGGELPF